ncbi:MAG: hypothetical protein AABW59_00280 [archaeon]
MPLFRRIVNRASKNLTGAKRLDKSEMWDSPDGPAGLLDIKGVQRVLKAQKRYNLAMGLRSKGPIGAVRATLASKEVRQRLESIKRIRELRAKGLDVTRTGKRPDYGAAKELLGDILPNQLIRVKSERGNIREGIFLETLNEGKLIRFRERNGMETMLRTEKLAKMDKIKRFSE